ncbi:hypothetical protein O0235_07090 [Tepidiforma flava]|uniref:Uncharacterized protein n=1 Tax=Tepidiforma flava TaxID=3004094 RepID=A0ABY7MD15_9CHLR|nr:hypothetical protein [Tepidiforma flava]WBL37331.1 hypothetical protein O0235_07090 [Tepidiforma flava]
MEVEGWRLASRFPVSGSRFPGRPFGAWRPAGTEPRGYGRRLEVEGWRLEDVAYVSFNSQLPTPNSQLPTPNSRLPPPGSRIPPTRRAGRW